MDRGRNLIPRSLFRSFPSLWEDMEDRMSQFMNWGSDTGVSVSEDNENVYVEAHLPGLTSDDLDIAFHQNTLWIKGSKKEEEEDKDKKFYRRAKNSFFYQVDLPTQVEENTEEAQYQDGVLRITFKKTRQGQMRKISVGGGSSEQSQQFKKNKNGSSSNGSK